MTATCKMWLQGIHTYNTEYGKFSYMVTWLAHNKIARKASRDRQKTEGGKKILSYGSDMSRYQGNPLCKMKITQNKVKNDNT